MFTSNKKNIVARGFDIYQKGILLFGIGLGLIICCIVGYEFDSFLWGIFAFLISLFIAASIAMIYGAVAEIIELLNDVKINTSEKSKNNNEQTLIDELPNL